MMVFKSTASDLDIQFDLLANSRRQLALKVIAAHGSSVTLRDLTNEIVAREQGTTLPDISSSAVMDVQVSLHHIHIPKLVDAGIIDYDRTRNHIEEADHAALQSMLSLLPANTRTPRKTATGASD